MWVATNQCLGGSVSRVNNAEHLNHQPRHCKNKQVRPIDGAAFSIAMNGTDVRLFISLKHNYLNYLSPSKSRPCAEPCLAALQ